MYESVLNYVTSYFFGMHPEGGYIQKRVIRKSCGKSVLWILVTMTPTAGNGVHNFKILNWIILIDIV